MSADSHRTPPPTETRLVELILGNIADGVFTVDSNFNITFFNHAAEGITGYSEREVIGRQCSEVFRTPICSQDCPLRQSLRTGRTVKNFEIDILTRRGKRQTISVCTTPLVETDGTFLGGVETFRDVSTLKELRREISGRYTFQDIISKNPRMRQIFEILPNVSQSDASVLLQGRSGTGKELFANAIHNLSPRAHGPLVKVNCGALPETLLESELFGHVKGAFTDAKHSRPGRFLAAEGGTILLDEIGDMPLQVQVKLLRVLQHREFEPLGSESTVKVDVRVVAATNQDLERLVAEGRFREDLFYRLNVILIPIPDLCERTEDIPLLADHFIERFNQRMGRSISGVSDEAMAALVRHGYPGNVRELENIIEHAFVVSPGPLLRIVDLPPGVRESLWPHEAPGDGPPPRLTSPWSAATAASERDVILRSLQRHQWNLPRAAKELGMHRTTLWRKVRRLQLRRT